jgi:ubiquitin C-terminal hydrolase
MQFRLGRQEDAHEFLRYFIEGLQKSDIDTKEKKPELIRQLT